MSGPLRRHHSVFVLVLISFRSVVGLMKMPADLCSAHEFPSVCTVSAVRWHVGATVKLRQQPNLTVEHQAAPEVLPELVSHLTKHKTLNSLARRNLESWHKCARTLDSQERSPWDVLCHQISDLDGRTRRRKVPVANTLVPCDEAASFPKGVIANDTKLGPTLV